MRRTILLMTAFLGLTALQSQAQSGTNTAPADKQAAPQKEMTPEEQAERQTRRMAKELGLTEDQQKQFKAFSLERINAMRPIHEKMKATEDKAERKKLHDESRVIKEKFDANVKSMLTPEQLPKWEAQKEQRMDKRKVHHDMKNKNNP